MATKSETHDLLRQVEREIGRGIIGQEGLVRGLLLGLLADGHILIEGVPGLGKTRAVNLLARVCQLWFRRIQFTPDLLPSDILGTRIYNQGSGVFDTVQGPVFTNFLLADEINRAPAKVQSALLETMQERQVTIGQESLPVPAPFLVFATQNPIEQEGTYPLPEAQLDRFLLKLVVSYPEREEEQRIVKMVIRSSSSRRRRGRCSSRTAWCATPPTSSTPPADPRSSTSSSPPTSSSERRRGRRSPSPRRRAPTP
jgi:MoxR-like ATPase